MSHSTVNWPTGRLLQVIKSKSVDLQYVLNRNPYIPSALDPGKILTALACVESGFGEDCGPRIEPAYNKGGRYYEANAQVKALIDKWGNWAAGSFGPWQILFVTAVELGFPAGNDPSVLHQPEISVNWVIRYLDHRAINGTRPARCLADIFDAYNSGRSGDKNVPAAYIKKALKAYEDPTAWIADAKRSRS